MLGPGSLLYGSRYSSSFCSNSCSASLDADLTTRNGTPVRSFSRPAACSAAPTGSWPERLRKFLNVHQPANGLQAVT